MTSTEPPKPTPAPAASFFQEIGTTITEAVGSKKFLVMLAGNGTLITAASKIADKHPAMALTSIVCATVLCTTYIITQAWLDKGKR